MKIRVIIILLFLFIIISSTTALRFLTPQFNSSVDLPPPDQWNKYTSIKYNFSVSYPPGWSFLEVPNADYPADIDQVLFSGSSFPSPQTGARADFHLFISQDDPTGNWQPNFFDDYLAEEVILGNLPATKISRINKESLHQELVIITKIGNYYLQAMPNFSSDSMKYYDQIVTSLQANTTDIPESPSIATDHPVPSPTGKVSYKGINFLFDTSLAELVTPQIIPSNTDLAGFTFNDIPQHVRFDFENPYTYQEPFKRSPQHSMPWLSHQNLGHVEMIPQIFIFPTRDFSDISQPASERITALKEMLRAESHPSNRELPVLPLFNSTQDVRAQSRYLEFHGGSGIRFITRYTQEATPVINPYVFYTFQGLTGDGEYYVSAFFPIYVSSLPNNIDIEDWDTFNRQYQTYLKDTAESLQELRSVEFEPDLAKLDTLIQSMTVLPTTLDAYLLPTTTTTKTTSISPYPEPINKTANTPITATGQPLCHDTLFEPIAFLSDNRTLLGRTNTGIRLLNLETMEEESYIEVPAEVVEAAISSSGQSLALAFGNHDIQLHDGQLHNTLKAHTNIITALKFSPTGDKLFSASHDNWVKIWDREGRLIKSFPPGGLEVLGIGVSPDGNKLVTISFEGPMKLWDISKSQVIQEFESPYGAFDGADAAFSADGQIVARGIGGGPITLYKVSDGTPLWSGGVYALAFSPDGRFLAISDVEEDGENIITLRSPDGKQSYMMLRGHESMILKLIFSPDSSILASVDDLELKIWQVENGRLLYSRSITCP